MSRILRKNLTDTERYLWRFLRNRQLNGVKFRRQQSVGKYIVDFVSFERKLIIEVDGGQHNFENNIEKDRRRDEWLRKQGYKVLRFWDNEVLNNIEGVIEVIKSKVSPSPYPSPTEGRGK